MLILLVAAWLPLIAVLPSLSLVRWLRRLSRGDLASLQETAQIALGVRTGFLAALYATLAIAIGGIFLAGFRDITYVLFGTEFLIGAELLLAGALESVLEFRLWLGGKGLDELKNADISTIWVNGRTPMRNFRDHFWALVPFYVRNRKNIGSIPPIERENGIILVLMVIIMLVSGFQPWTVLLMSGGVSVTIFSILCAYTFRVTLARYDGQTIARLHKQLQTGN